MNLNRPKAPDGFFLVSQIGRGSSSEVWLGKHSNTNTKVAIKVIKKNPENSQIQRKQLFEEISIQKQFQHPYLATFYGMKENLENYYIIMEFLPRGTINSKVAREGILSECKARRYFTQIVYAMKYLNNNQKIIHRDLKAENVMIDSNNNIRIIDFGLSCKLTQNHLLSLKCGSPYYIAPEIYLNHEYDNSVDVWSCGILLFYMVAGFFPFDGPTQNDVKNKVLNKNLTFPPFVKNELKDLLAKMLDKNPSTRISFDAILRHPWVMRKNSEIEPDLIDFSQNDSLIDRIKKREKNLKFFEKFSYQVFSKPAKKHELNEIGSDFSSLSTPILNNKSEPDLNLPKSKSDLRFPFVNRISPSISDKNDKKLNEKSSFAKDDRISDLSVSRNKPSDDHPLSNTSSNSKINF